MILLSRVILVFLVLGAATGCAMNRTGVQGLSESQDAYYKKLHEELVSQRDGLKHALKAQSLINAKYRKELNSWARDVEQAELLQTADPTRRANKRLLSIQLAHRDTRRVAVLHAGDQAAAQQIEAIVGLYNRLVEAVAELRRNNTLITAYLGSRDEEFFLRSVDVSGLAAAVEGLRTARAEIEGSGTRNEEERARERQLLEQAAVRAREVLLRAFERSP